MVLAPIGRRPEIISHARQGDFASVNAIVSCEINAQLFAFQIDSSLTPVVPAVAWCKSQDGRSTFSFNEDIFVLRLEHIVNRLLDTLPLLHQAACAPDVHGSCIVNVGDRGRHPGLCYCDYRPEFPLVPDCIFLGQRGYADLRAQFSAAPVDWRDRRPVVFWRGSTTGARTGAISDLPRIRLCLKAKALGARADMGVSALVQLGSEEERQEVEALDVIKGHLPASHFDQFKYHLDIDGNSNSWPGLLMKLHSGSPVLKVASPLGYRQWYYDRLAPWVNYVPVASDLSDLEERLSVLEMDDDLAQSIGLEGQRLARDLTLEREIERARPTIEWALQAGLPRLESGTGA